MGNKSNYTGLTDPLGRPISSEDFHKTKQDGTSNTDIPEDIPLPEPTFVNHIISLVTAARSYLGLKTHPEQSQPKPHKRLAQYHIDTIEAIKDKVQSNLTPEEASFIEQSLYDLRTRFVQLFVNNKPNTEK